MADATETRASSPQRRRRAKGRRPFFLEDPDNDKLLAMIAALAGEVSILHRRLIAHESVAANKALFSGDDIEAHQPSQEEVEALSRWRSEFLGRVFRILEFEVDEEGLARARADYERMLDGFAREHQETDDGQR